jgi:2-keto-4-pentenoate hydratase/2-oxohepta-3-ene-1,7-dioic acid hydratase in catechol pathway
MPNLADLDRTACSGEYWRSKNSPHGPVFLYTGEQSILQYERNLSSMILLTFKHSGVYRLGISTSKGVIDVAAANMSLQVPNLVETPAALFSQGLSALPILKEFCDLALVSDRSAGWLLDEEKLEAGPCVPDPGKIICIGLNYRRHAQEAKLEVPPVPILFSKFSNALAAPGEPLPLPPVATKYDYEAELAVVIGKRARYVREEDALGYVLGYCNANDVSARELQGLTSQWLLGKSLNKFLPIGPYLVTSDEAPDPQNWPIRCWLNGELRQDSNTADMIFPVTKLISFISQYMTLDPGDVISTGTPEGVIIGKPSPRVWMKPGDVMTVEVGPLGKLTNPLVAETI